VDEIDDTTEAPNPVHAREAFQSATTDAIDTAAVVAESKRLVQEVRSVRERNHFADKFRSIIQGTRG
jgi:hypothetical protein